MNGKSWPIIVETLGLHKPIINHFTDTCGDIGQSLFTGETLWRHEPIIKLCRDSWGEINQSRSCQRSSDDIDEKSLIIVETLCGDIDQSPTTIVEIPTATPTNQNSFRKHFCSINQSLPEVTKNTGVKCRQPLRLERMVGNTQHTIGRIERYRQEKKNSEKSVQHLRIQSKPL